ncbi:retrotransposon hot spot protein (RHS) [Trypanosoma conorhini]|uniref:Retrotransposon hot spot protein (RHS) n=1 Tax=Trypanosoma conorhini TaxID=83891 RepID=A0A3R7MFF3_9TRYP|nr:retrotransposon hot spot protein (RHS) [Trypanosoma conorhini]RNF01529.1 retrotransposon hot spot protein (RHS) [Trypanosoma conorhini]
MNAGSYLLYQLLHYDDYPKDFVLYCLGGELAYMFDKEEETVTEYKGAKKIKETVRHLECRWKGFIIYDAAEDGGASLGFQPYGCGMIVLKSPNGKSFGGWVRREGCSNPTLSCPREDEVKVMCAWMKRGRPAQEQADYWETVKQRMQFVGPIPRYIFTDADFNGRPAALGSVLQAIDASVAQRYFSEVDDKVWSAKNPLWKLVKIERERRGRYCSVVSIVPACGHIRQKLLDRLCEVLTLSEAVSLLTWGSRLS